MFLQSLCMIIRVYQSIYSDTEIKGDKSQLHTCSNLCLIICILRQTVQWWDAVFGFIRRQERDTNM